MKSYIKFSRAVPLMGTRALNASSGFYHFTANHLKMIMFFIFFGMISGCNDNKVTLEKSRDGYILSNGKIKAVFTTDEDGYIDQHFYAADTTGIFQLVVESFRPVYPDKDDTETAKLFNTSLSPHRYLISEIVSDISIDRKTKTIIVSGQKDGLSVVQRINLEPDSENFHINVECVFPEDINRVDYVLSTFEYNLDNAPFFVHTPGLKFDNKESRQNRFRIVDSKDQIIGDRAFHSPAVILQEGTLFAALVPDLDFINDKRVLSPDARRVSWIRKNKFSVPEVRENFTMPTGLDLNVKSGITEKPVFSYGYIDAIIGHHIRYNRFNDSTMVRTIEGNTLNYAFNLFVDAGSSGYGKYSDVAKFIWEKYGSKEFNKGIHLAMPFEEYHKIIDSITFHPSRHPDIDIPLEGYKNTGSWLEWEEDGVPMGGYRSAINWWNDKVHNSAFWNNARDASGFYYWGEKLDYSENTDRAQRIINWCLSAPRNQHGLFATLYNANSKKWALQFTDPMHGRTRFFLDHSDSYSISTMSKTGAHLLSYYLRFEKDNRIVTYLKPYGDWLLTAIDGRGSLPAFVSKEMEESDILRYSAHPAASMWFLAELYNATHEDKYLEGAKRISDYLIKEIIPEAKWIDFEQFYSCGKRPLFFQRDIVQNQIARGNLSIIWASEGYAALHRATQEKDFLEMGEKCIDYLSFFQCSWDPHYVYTAYPFGGFTVDNSDNATFLDARQAETVKPFIYFGKELGRQDLIERGIAAARSSIVLMNHPLHKKNGIYEFTNIYPFGLGPENIDHEAHPQSAMRTHPGWGEGSGVYTGLSEALWALGGAYINIGKNLFAGVDGVRVNEVNYRPGHLSVSIEADLFKLKEPWHRAHEIELRIEGVNAEDYFLKINNISIGMKKGGKEERLRVRFSPDGSIEVLADRQNVSQGAI